MATEIRVPTLGESVTEATIGKWFKKVGDAVAADETLVELETDKVTVEVPSPAAGVLSEIAAGDGETVGVGAVLGAIDAGAASKAAKAEAPAAAPVKQDAVAQASAPTAASTVREAVAQTAKIAGEGPIEQRRMPPAPSAAKLLAESNISVDQVQGTGKRGQVLKGDVLDIIARGAPSQPVETPKVARPPSVPEDESREERVRYTGRPASASPATGLMSKHLAQLSALLEDALGE